MPGSYQAARDQRSKVLHEAQHLSSLEEEALRLQRLVVEHLKAAVNDLNYVLSQEPSWRGDKALRETQGSGQLRRH